MIQDYAAGQDTIKISGKVSSYSISSSDAVLKIGSGKVTLKDAADTAVTIVGADSIASIYNGDYFSTETWTGGVEQGTPGVFPPETVTLPAVTLPAETITVGGDLYVITDYGTGNDKISIGANSVSGGMLVSNDVVFAIGNGMLKFTGAKNKAVTMISGGTETEYINGVIPGSETVPPDDTTPADSGITVTLESNFTGNFSLTSYNATAETAA